MVSEEMGTHDRAGGEVDCGQSSAIWISRHRLGFLRALSLQAWHPRRQTAQPALCVLLIHSWLHCCACDVSVRLFVCLFLNQTWFRIAAFNSRREGELDARITENPTPHVPLLLLMCSNGVWKRERFDARRSQQPVYRQLWTTGRWEPSVGVYSLGSDPEGAALRHGLRSQYPRLSERRDLLPRLGRIQLPPPDHHHLSGHGGHATRALHQNRCGRDHPLRHHLPEPAFAQQLVPGSEREQRDARPHRGRDADQPHQRQGTA